MKNPVKKHADLPHLTHRRIMVYHKNTAKENYLNGIRKENIHHERTE